MKEPATTTQTIPFWRDERILQILGQAGFIVVVIAGGYFLFNNMVSGLQKQGMTLGLSFLSQIAGFDIGETLIEYSRSSSYWRAFQVGVLNTLLISSLGIIFSTVLGVLVGVARLSENFIINRIARVYLEFIRNIPLLVLLVFWYTAVFLKLPRVKQAIIWPGPVYLTNRGVAIPWGIPSDTFSTFLAILAAGLVLAVGMGFAAGRVDRLAARASLVRWLGGVVFVVVGIAAWLGLDPAPWEVSVPYVKGLNLDGGLVLSPEIMALLSGLVFYTAAFIGEVVRAGIQAVSRGQVEASRALGLTGYQILRLVVFPQAMRVIIPPLTSQYLNLTKNSSLAVAIAYPDVFYVSSTIRNQSGRAVEMITLIMLVYLAFSLLTSLFMNWYNQKIRLVER